MQQVRGNKIGMIFQEPLTSLNPVLRIGDQLSEGLIVHKGLSEEEARGSVSDSCGRWVLMRQINGTSSIPISSPAGSGSEC